MDGSIFVKRLSEAFGGVRVRVLKPDTSRLGESVPQEATSWPLAIRASGSLLGIAYLYFLGWSYNYNYLSYFGIGSQATSVPFYVAFVYSFTLIALDWPRISVIVLVSYAFLHLCTRFRPVAEMICTTAILVAAFLFSYAETRQTGRRAAESIVADDSLARVQFVSTSGATMSGDLANAEKAGALRLITQSPERYFVLNAANHSAVEVFEIRADDVLIAHVFTKR